MKTRRFALEVAAAVILLGVASAAGREPGAAADSPSTTDAARATIAADKAALAPWQTYIGRWKGVGLPKRGSNQGAWTEAADWAWQFEKSRAAIEFQSPQGKYYSAARITSAEKPNRFELVATRVADKSEDHFVGAKNTQGEFVFQLEQSEKPTKQGDKQSDPSDKQVEKPKSSPADRAAQQPARITLRQVADGKRLLVLYERRIEGTDQFVRLAEVGYTREGSGFAKAGGGSPECVVTGGLGAIAVQHEGKTYYVCCSGCQDLFNDDPTGVLADYRARKEKERAK